MTTSRATSNGDNDPAATAFAVSAVVRMTAIGSLKPDSTSSVNPILRRSCVPLAESTEKTAAASVDDTIAPTRSATCHEYPRKCAANGGDARRADDAECREHQRRRGDEPYTSHRRLQAAVEQNHHERRGAEAIRDVIVLECDPPDALGSGEYADEQKDERQRHPDAHRCTTRRDAEREEDADRQQNERGPGGLDAADTHQY